MKIETKYNIGDWVHFMCDNQAHVGVIKKINIYVEDGKTNTFYTVTDQNSSLDLQLGTPYLFPTKAELLKSL